MYSKQISLFVPGRLCIMGEHSDWAGTNRMMNADIVPGMAIVTGIEQGVYATVERSDRFIIESDLPCYNGERFVCDMDTELLRRSASSCGFFSYVAGVASYVSEHYNVGGLHVTVTKMDLPIKSGLSSSAAICVLIARAFNILYHLHLNTMGEMNVAYMGEQRTPSRCGRLDQACAFGTKPVCMTFDGNELSVRPLTIRKNMYWVVADLNGSKDTVKILADLNKCFPFANNELERTVQRALGPDNRAFVEEAVVHMENGDCEKLGELMYRYQKNFDDKVAPACPEQLASPILHSVLDDPVIREFVYGGKGVGSQGDGTVQFLAKSSDCQTQLIEYLKERHGMSAVPFTIRPQQKIRKAVIPLAGFGTRLFPATKCLKKSFFPIPDRDGILKPALLILLQQLEEAGIEEICLIIGDDEREEYESFFRPLSKEYYDKLPEDRLRYEDLILKIGKKVTYAIQKERKGFGHAVYQCREFTDNEPILLLLGDTIYRTDSEENCMTQMIRAYESCGLPIVSMHRVPKEDVVHYGILHGQWEDDEQRFLKLDAVIEKPVVSYAEDFLSVSTKDSAENYYAVFGLYVLTPEVFDVLNEHIESGVTQNGEIQLTGALEETRRRSGMVGCVVDGQTFDIGLPDKYLETMTEYSRH